MSASRRTKQISNKPGDRDLDTLDILNEITFLLRIVLINENNDENHTSCVKLTDPRRNRGH